MAMAVSDDTEITLGTGKMLFVFFGLVALCGVFFGMGFVLGKSSVKGGLVAEVVNSSPAANGARPSAVKMQNSSPSPDLAFYKSAAQKNSDAPAAAKNPADAGTEATDGTAAPADVAPPLNGYYVQVAAVSKQEDAQALVEALKKKQYEAFANSAPADKLFHVQVGPFPDIKDAELTRAKLVSGGYNPILKK